MSIMFLVKMVPKIALVHRNDIIRVTFKYVHIHILFSIIYIYTIYTIYIIIYYNIIHLYYLSIIAEDSSVEYNSYFSIFKPLFYKKLSILKFKSSFCLKVKC